ncbi:hypothetical protein [Saccharopolyspora gregorii]|uniref:PE domain-containing protein n=1 Tax=Saccharopolyspora gregorii TaxID=33914 RepID=A0ABP6RRP1_9PSEU
MSESIAATHEVMLAAAGRIREAGDIIGMGGTDFRSDAALEDAVPAPTEEQAMVDPLNYVHMQVAQQVRGPYRDCLVAVDEFRQAAQEMAERLALDVQRSAEEYLAREQQMVDDLGRVRRQLDEGPR